MAEVVVLRQVRQTADWDCGLACIEMMMRWMHQLYPHVFHIINANHLHAQLRKAMPFRSVWTIDLVAYLWAWIVRANQPAHMKVEVWFASTSMQVNPVHASHPYYSADYAADVARVAPLYSSWRDRSFQGQVSTAELKRRMRMPTAVLLVLVDASHLECCVWNDTTTLQLTDRPSFQGHFILVTAITDDKGNIVVFANIFGLLC
ncbi:hypothetical protein, variant 1 [Aphanomyces astaci]|uniref:Peptidase C39 domain-containing protein n=1 Tax=Aphanomyces astaci TaxID=112090 RepID=W4F9Z4_APHAT|nr:hypothetical protein, variant 1 [Aphanomyces astaci]ETV63739.1 hypothetical protein, variant 1 [Aphanomyces astaci]|eukprot:XP_009846777.1 hypothetical protein, variant 1 [Aphanomyces astaci]